MQYKAFYNDLRNSLYSKINYTQRELFLSMSVNNRFVYILQKIHDLVVKVYHPTFSKENKLYIHVTNI